MATHVSHAGIPLVKGARFTIPIPYFNDSGDPTDPVTPDTERSIDGAAFADCTEEATTITGSNGSGFVTLTGDETNCSLLCVAAKVASGPKPTLLMARIPPHPSLTSGTAQAGGNTSITLASDAPSYDLAGCIVKTTGGTGGGDGSGSRDNQARVITAYNGTTKVATVDPAWEVNPGATTTYTVLTQGSPVNLAGTEVGSVAGAVGSVTGAVGSVTAGVTLAASAIQAIWDKATSGLTTAGSIGKLIVDNLNSSISGLAAAVWTYATRTLTQSAASVVSAVTGSTITVYRGTKWTISLTGLGSLTGWTKLYFTVRANPDGEDSQSLIQIVVTNPAAGSTDGLLYVNGSAATVAQRTKAAIVVDDATAGDITITLDADVSNGISEQSAQYDVKMISASSVDLKSSGGQFRVVADITRAVA